MRARRSPSQSSGWRRRPASRPGDGRLHLRALLAAEAVVDEADAVAGAQPVADLRGARRTSRRARRSPGRPGAARRGARRPRSRRAARPRGRPRARGSRRARGTGARSAPAGASPRGRPGSRGRARRARARRCASVAWKVALAGPLDDRGEPEPARGLALLVGRVVEPHLRQLLEVGVRRSGGRCASARAR